MIYPQTLVFLLLISPTLLNSLEVTPPSPEDTKAALQTIGLFFKDNGGINWLSEMAQGRVTPVTTEELMKKIINSSTLDIKIKNAAGVVKSALELQKRKGVNGTEPLELEGWKDLVENVENQDNIICLYRKSSNMSSEDANDWEKFMKNMWSNYVVYLAIDMGHKYMICFKKIDIPAGRKNVNSTKNVTTTVAPKAAEQKPVMSQGSRSLGGGPVIKFNDHVHDSKCNHPSYDAGHQRFYDRYPVHNYENYPCQRPIIYVLPPNNYLTPYGPSGTMPYGYDTSAPQYSRSHQPQNLMALRHQYYPHIYNNMRDSMASGGKVEEPKIIKSPFVYPVTRSPTGHAPTPPRYQPPPGYPAPSAPAASQGALRGPTGLRQSQQYPHKLAYRVNPNFYYPQHNLPLSQHAYTHRALDSTKYLPFSIGWPPLLVTPARRSGIAMPALTHPNCPPCPEPCDRPILVKVLVDNTSLNRGNSYPMADAGLMMEARRSMDGPAGISQEKWEDKAEKYGGKVLDNGSQAAGKLETTTAHIDSHPILDNLNKQ